MAHRSQHSVGIGCGAHRGARTRVCVGGWQAAPVHLGQHEGGGGGPHTRPHTRLHPTPSPHTPPSIHHLSMHNSLGYSPWITYPTAPWCRGSHVRSGTATRTTPLSVTTRCLLWLPSLLLPPLRGRLTTSSGKNKYMVQSICMVTVLLLPPAVLDFCPPSSLFLI